MADEPTNDQEQVQAEAQEETPVEEVKESSSAEASKDTEKTSSKVSKKLETLISDIENLSVLELADLVKALEDKFGVVAAAPVAAAAAPTANGGSAPAGEPAEEQTTFNVILANGGANKISVIKAVREINQNLGLKEAKDLVEAAPKELLTGVNKATAQEAKTKLEAAGATVELK